MAAGGSATEIAPKRRRGKSALFVVGCGWAGMAPHWLDPSIRLIPSITVALLLGGYVIRTVLAAVLRSAKQPSQSPEASLSQGLEVWPSVDVVVAARDEQAVIGRLVERMALVRYPEGLLKLWVVDDGSTDRTPEVLADLQDRFPFLHLLRRAPDAGGGKSGALNEVLQQLQARWMLVLDADADLQGDTLERLIPYAEAGRWSAVQLRKAEVNASVNWLTKLQAMEMAFDAVIQQGRLATAGVAELRGNGQLLRLDALHSCGGFNEATVTDDLDLSFRLLIDQQPIGVLWNPPVQEEAVLGLAALWRQRQRWAEGGLQRFFDYGPQLFFGRLKASQKLDLLCFFLLQYALPMVAMADLAGALVTATRPTIWPLSVVVFALSGISIVAGCTRSSEGPALPAMNNPLSLALGIVYLGHWFVVIPWTSIRMALLPKRLVWAKTLHLGEENADGELTIHDDLAGHDDPATA